MAAHNKTIGRFHLDGIPPAPRGIPKIKVKFDYTSASLDNFTIRTYGFIDHKRDYPQ